MYKDGGLESMYLTGSALWDFSEIFFPGVIGYFLRSGLIMTASDSLWRLKILLWHNSMWKNCNEVKKRYLKWIECKKKQLFFVFHAYWNNTLNWLVLHDEELSVCSMLLNFSSGIKAWQPFPCLLLCGNSMLFCEETSIFWRYINNFSQYFLMLGHGTNTTVVKRSLFQTFVANFDFVWLRVTTTASSATQTSFFPAAEFFLEKTRFLLIMFLRLMAASMKKQNCCWIG